MSHGRRWRGVRAGLVSGVAAAVSVLLLVSGCAAGARAGGASPADGATPANDAVCADAASLADVAARADTAPPARLREAVERVVQNADGRVGVAIRLLETGQCFALAGDEHFPMQSVYKLPIAMAALHEVDAGRLSGDQPVVIDKAELGPPSFYSPIRDRFPDGATLTIGDLLRYAVSASDNVASDTLLRLVGGPERVTAYLRGLGVDDVAVATSVREMAADEAAQFRNWSTPRAVVRLLAVYQSGAGLSAESHARLSQALLESFTGPRRIKGLLPPDVAVAHKTGSGRTVDGRTIATNDVGIITLPDGRHLAVAVFVADSAADAESRDRTIAQIARAAYDAFAEGSRE